MSGPGRGELSLQVHSPFFAQVVIDLDRVEHLRDGDCAVMTVTSAQFRDSHCREFLVTHQNSDGGWGYHPASPSAVEATAWALSALISSRQGPPSAEACARAGDWLLQAQRADGSW